MDTSIALVAVLAPVAACSGQTAASSFSNSAPDVDIVAPPPGVADRGDDPAVVAIKAAGAPVCAGVLLASDVVLTARHCVSAPAAARACPSEDAAAAPPLRAPSSLRVLVGDDMATAAVRARGRDIRVPDAATMCGADIALLLLDASISDVQPLAVRFTGAAQGDHLRSIGWRVPVHAGPAAKILRDHLLVLGASATELELAEMAGGGGGPAIDESTAEVLGVFSRGEDDRSRAVYTRADAFVGLIEGALAESESAAASTHALKPKKGPADLGATCVQGGDCAAGVCVSLSGGPSRQQYCSRTCASHDRCPSGFRCQRSQGGASVCTET